LFSLQLIFVFSLLEQPPNDRDSRPSDDDTLGARQGTIARLSRLFTGPMHNQVKGGGRAGSICRPRPGGEIDDGANRVLLVSQIILSDGEVSRLQLSFS
jgi:hypothetical protein